MKTLIYFGLIFYLPFVYSHDIKQIDITDRCFIERDKIELGSNSWDFYRIKTLLTSKEMIDYTDTSPDDIELGRLELKLTLNVDGSEKTIIGVISGFFVAKQSYVTGQPFYDIENSFINESENVSIKNCTILTN